MVMPAAPARRRARAQVAQGLRPDAADGRQRAAGEHARGGEPAQRVRVRVGRRRSRRPARRPAPTARLVVRPITRARSSPASAWPRSAAAGPAAACSMSISATRPLSGIALRRFDVAVEVDRRGAAGGSASSAASSSAAAARPAAGRGAITATAFARRSTSSRSNRSPAAGGRGAARRAPRRAGRARHAASCEGSRRPAGHVGRARSRRRRAVTPAPADRVAGASAAASSARRSIAVRRRPGPWRRRPRGRRRRGTAALADRSAAYPTSRVAPTGAPTSRSSAADGPASSDRSPACRSFGNVHMTASTSGRWTTGARPSGRRPRFSAGAVERVAGSSRARTCGPRRTRGGGPRRIRTRRAGCPDAVLRVDALASVGGEQPPRRPRRRGARRGAVPRGRGPAACAPRSTLRSSIRPLYSHMRRQRQQDAAQRDRVPRPGAGGPVDPRRRVVAVAQAGHARDRGTAPARDQDAHERRARRGRPRRR